ncbi:AIR synthase related protein, partial [Vallitalea sediminicola]
MIEKFRDITLLSFDHKNILTVACDSCGGIGNKEHDVIKVDPYVTGYYTAVVSLSETIALGAEPVTVINTFAVEMEDTGKRIMEGINDALDKIGLDRESVVTGSTEENIPVTVTG